MFHCYVSLPECNYVKLGTDEHMMNQDKYPSPIDPGGEKCYQYYK